MFVLIFNWVFGKQNKSNSVSWQQITTCWQNWHFSYIFGVFVYKDENDQFKNKRLRSVFTKTKQTFEIHKNCWTENSLQFWRLPIVGMIIITNLTWKEAQWLQTLRCVWPFDKLLCSFLDVFDIKWGNRLSTLLIPPNIQETSIWIGKGMLVSFFSIKHLFYWFNIPILFAPTLKRWFCNAVKYRVLCIMLVFLISEFRSFSISNFLFWLPCT